MWLDEDTTAALEYIEYEESLCPGCGFPRHESFDPANEEAFHAEPIACHACATRQRKAQKWAEAENSDTAGVYWAVTRDDDPPSRRSSGQPR